MNTSERIKQLRKALNLTQDAFGNELGITKSSVSRIEAGIINLTDQMAKLICRTFNVDYFWLTEGVGEMFVVMTVEEEIAAYMGDLLANDDEDREFQRRFIKALSKLDLKDWKEKIFPMIDWHFANRRWRNHNGKYSNSYGGS